MRKDTKDALLKLIPIFLASVVLTAIIMPILWLLGMRF